MSDTDAKWSSALGLSLDLTERGLGIRTNRYAMIIDDLELKYLGVSIAFYFMLIFFDIATYAIVEGASGFLLPFRCLLLLPG